MINTRNDTVKNAINYITTKLSAQFLKVKTADNIWWTKLLGSWHSLVFTIVSAGRLNRKHRSHEQNVVHTRNLWQGSLCRCINTHISCIPFYLMHYFVLDKAQQDGASNVVTMLIWNSMHYVWWRMVNVYAGLRMWQEIRNASGKTASNLKRYVWYLYD